MVCACVCAIRTVRRGKSTLFSQKINESNVPGAVRGAGVVTAHAE